jgi:Ni,Fe-hydrogenase I small subunit
MADATLNQAGEAEGFQPIEEIDILWITAGLSCDGDTIAMTAASNPSIEDLVLGAIPGIPKIHFLNRASKTLFSEPFRASRR